MVVFPDPLVRIFTGEPEVIGFGVRCLRVISYGYVFYAWGMVLMQAFNGAGDTMTPTRLNLVCFWMMEIPLAWVLAHRAGWGPAGVYWSVAISESVLAVLSLLAYRRGGWKTRVV